MVPTTRHAARLLPILLVAIGLYARVTGGTFCSYDDYIEVHRAAFEDSVRPARMFTTPHFKTFKYRPLNRAFNLLSYEVGGGTAAAFRVRNLACHLIDAVLVYTLALALLRSARAATVAAALFAVHPLANQTVIGSVMTNTAAHGLLLAGLLCWIRALDMPGTPGVVPIAGLACALLSLFFYDAAVAFYPMVVLYAVVAWRATRRGPSPRLVALFVTGAALSVGIYLAFRLRFVPHGFGGAASERAGLGAIAHNVALYAAALLGPVDPVLAHFWFGFPFPPELSARHASLVPRLVLGLGAIALGVLLVLGWRQVLRTHAPDRRVSGGWIPLLLIGLMALALGPLVVFSAHASETYVYLPLAFLTVLMAGAVEPLFATRRGLGVALVAVALALFSAATWVRCERVRTSADTAGRILAAMPSSLAYGDWRVTLADVPGEPRTVRYGFYGFQGTGTIGTGDAADRALTSALQLRYHTGTVSGRVIGPTEFEPVCAAGGGRGEWIAWVHADGRVDPCARIAGLR